MRICVLMGPPGAGKGTVCDGLRRYRNVVRLATGDLLREAVKNGTEFGLKAKGYMERGELVPDDIMINLIKENLAKNTGIDSVILIDGFPRTIKQAEAMEIMVQRDFSSRIDLVIFIDVADEILIDRLSGRLTCTVCGSVYHIRNVPPKVPGKCDVCGGALYQRVDDSPETIRRRLDVYKKDTASLISFFESRGLLKRVSGIVNPNDLVSRVIDIMKEKGICFKN